MDKQTLLDRVLDLDFSDESEVAQLIEDLANYVSTH